jgi:hypothetical protein
MELSPLVGLMPSQKAKGINPDDRWKWSLSEMTFSSQKQNIRRAKPAPLPDFHQKSHVDYTGNSRGSLQ